MPTPPARLTVFAEQVVLPDRVSWCDTFHFMILNISLLHYKQNYCTFAYLTCMYCPHSPMLDAKHNCFVLNKTN